MKKISRSFKTTVSVFSFFVLSSSAVSAPSYFGYFCSSCEQVGPLGDYTEYISDHANLSFVAGSSIDSVLSRIKKASTFQMKSIVVASASFVEGHSSQLAPYLSNIAAFYPMDEPNNIPYSTIYSEVSRIKQVFPNVPVAAIYMAEFGGSYSGANLFDWVGIDCYEGPDFRCGALDYSVVFYDFKSHLKSGARTILVPQAGRPSKNSAPFPNAGLVEKYKNLSSNDSSVIAVMPFLYQSFSDGDNWAGLEDNPYLRCSFVSYAQSFVWRPPSNLTRVYRFYHPGFNDHFYSTNLCEGTNAGYRFEGVGFYVSSTASAGMHGLYRCSIHGSGKHMVSSDPGCEGQTAEGLLGFVYNAQSFSNKPLYRFYSAFADDHIATYNYNEGAAAGWGFDNYLGFSPLPSVM